MALRLVTDYSCGLADGQLPELTVVGPDAEKQRFGDPPPRATYSGAFLSALAAGPAPVICLAGPYAYSPAFTAAAGARNDLGRQKVDPNLVHVINAGRAFLGLGAIAAALAESGVGPERALRWLNEEANAASMWLVARSEALRGLDPAYGLEAPKGVPPEEFALLRVRLGARVMGGFEDVGAALDDAAGRAGVTGACVVLSAPGLGVSADAIAARMPAARRCESTLPAWLSEGLGEVAGFAVSPIPMKEAPGA